MHYKELFRRDALFRLLAFMLMIFCCALENKAQNNYTILMTDDQNMSGQNFFCSGKGTDIDEAKIKKYWDEGKRITGASNGPYGWMVTMAECDYTAQTYKYSQQFPSEWIKEKWNEDYYITTFKSSRTKWFVVMSKGKNYTGQVYKKSKDWDDIKAFIQKYWKEDYYITEAHETDGLWMIIMTQGTGFTDQGYYWADNYKELAQKADDVCWNKGHNLSLIESYDGGFFAVYSNSPNLDGKTQIFNTIYQDPTNFIKKEWNDNKRIASLSGFYKAPVNTYSSSSSSNSHNSNNGNQGNGTRKWRVNLPGGGYTDYTMTASGKTTAVTRAKCAFCNGTGGCLGCSNRGGYIGYGGVWYRCTMCGGSCVCYKCHGKGYTIITTVSQNGQGYGYSDQGTYTTRGGGGGYSGGYNSGSSYGGSSGSGSGSNSSRYGYYTCPTCYGSGKCSICGGDGLADSYYTGDKMACSSCNGTGKCSVCNGTGKKYGVK